jgi:hypothetical protein
LPKATPEGRKALADLMRCCVADGGLEVLSVAKGQWPQWRVADLAKLRKVLSARKRVLTPIVWPVAKNLQHFLLTPKACLRSSFCYGAAGTRKVLDS